MVTIDKILDNTLYKQRDSIDYESNLELEKHGFVRPDNWNGPENWRVYWKENTKELLDGTVISEFMAFKDSEPVRRPDGFETAAREILYGKSTGIENLETDLQTIEDVLALNWSKRVVMREKGEEAGTIGMLVGFIGSCVLGMMSSPLLPVPLLLGGLHYLGVRIANHTMKRDYQLTDDARMYNARHGMTSMYLFAHRPTIKAKKQWEEEERQQEEKERKNRLRENAEPFGDTVAADLMRFGAGQLTEDDLRGRYGDDFVDAIVNWTGEGPEPTF